MTTSISPQMRIIAVVGLVAVAALVAATQLVLRGNMLADEPAPVSTPREASAPAAPATPSETPKAQATQDAATKAAPATTKPVVRATSPTAKKSQTPATHPSPTTELPPLLAQALREHRVVVVSLFTPKARVDRLARAEAESAAGAAGAGFVALNLLEKENIEPLTAELGIVRAPSVFVYTRPAKVFVRLHGFADMATVAQAAANARRP